jgi:hypothetical protein
VSIHAHLLAHLDPSGHGLLPGGERLPDEAPYDGTSVRWGAGALDGVIGHHGGGGEGTDVDEVARLLGRTRRGWRREAARRPLYDAVRETSVLSYVDALLPRLEPGADHEVAAWLVRTAEHREPLKLGIALLGLAATPEDLDVLRVLARHDELTLYAAVALAGHSADPELELWALARAVEGWGRVHVVERLAGTERPEIQHWLLREGFRNSVMDEYLAHTAATTGDLVGALSSAPDDPALLAGAVGILTALLNGGPAEDIDDYEDGAVALRLVLGRVLAAPGDAREALLARAVRDHDTLPEEVRELAGRVLAHEGWPAVVTAGLGSPDRAAFWAAQSLAPDVGVDPFPALLERLRQEPHGSWWFDAVRHVDDARLPELLALADTHLAGLGTGPADELGLGAGYHAHSALEYVVQGLARFPGAGERQVLDALRSPVVRSRNLALRTLTAWGRDAWSPSVEPALWAARGAEPVDDVRARVERVLAGQPLED